MDIEILREAYWSQKQGLAELTSNGSVMTRVAFNGRAATVTTGERLLQIGEVELQPSQLHIIEGDSVLLVQKNNSRGGNRSVIQIGGRTYESRILPGSLYNLTYFTREGAGLLSYRLMALKNRKAALTFMVSDSALPGDDLFLLFLLGYFSVQNVIRENRPSPIPVLYS